MSYAAPEAETPSCHSPAMDVYSFGVLLMEMILHTPPSPTVAERKAQSQTIQWQSMKVLVQHCLNEDRHKRPSIAHVLSELGELGKQ
jgi:serine/threonine protein kinase